MMRRSRGRAIGRGALALIGLAALAWFAARVDWPQTWQLLGRLGALAPLILLPYLAVYLVDTVGWLLAFGRSVPVTFGRLFRIRWAGEAVNNVVPSAYVGGEAVKVLLLRRLGVSAADGTAAAVVSKTLQSVAQLVFLSGGALAFLSLGTAARGFAGAMAAFLAGGFALLTLWFLLQRRGLFATLATALRRFGAVGQRLANRLEPLRAVDDRVAGFWRSHPAWFWGSLAAYLGGWCLDTVEIWLVARLLGEAISWRQAIAIEAFTGMAKALAVVIPGALGVQETSIVFLGRMAGISEPVGAAYALIRRGREVLFALIGWKFLLLEQLRVRDLVRSTHAGRPESSK